MATAPLPANLDELLAAAEPLPPECFLFFWGHTPRREGAPVGKECLSQWYPAPFKLGGDRYATAEHYMMVRKALLFGDHKTAARIRAARTPAEAKKLGRAVQHFSESTWVTHREEIVLEASIAKFRQNAPLLRYLLGTRGRLLVEASPTDRIWGIGLAQDDPRAADPHQWAGLNLLGFTLMRARAALEA
jgi:ribA/ribD-fused uncharacterized protein